MIETIVIVVMITALIVLACCKVSGDCARAEEAEDSEEQT